jgi:hypothetical protein
MWSVRPKNRYKHEAVRPDSTREVAELRPQTHGRAEELAKRDLSREAAKVMVVGPPGCCGCVSASVSSGSRRKH